MQRLFVLLMAGSMVLASSVQAAKLKTGKLAGSLKSSVYIAPEELFRIPSPVSPDLEGHVEDLYNKDGKGMVSFTDDVGHLYRIEYFKIAPETAQQIAAAGEQVFFERFLMVFYLPNTIWLAIPDSKLLAKTFTTEPDGPLLMGWAFLPKGSMGMVSHNGSKPEREDSYRTIALFIRKQLMYVVQVAPSSPTVGLGKKKSAEELQPIVEKATRDFIRTIETK